MDSCGDAFVLVDAFLLFTLPRRGRAVFKSRNTSDLRCSQFTLPPGESSLSEERANPDCQHC